MPLSSWRPTLTMSALRGAICVAARVQRRPGGNEHMPDLSQVIDALRAAYDSWGYPLVLLGALLENTALLGLVLPGGPWSCWEPSMPSKGSWPGPWCSCWAGWAGA